MLYSLRMCFYGKKHEKIIHLREWLKLAQVIIVNNEVDLRKSKSEKTTKTFGLDFFNILVRKWILNLLRGNVDNNIKEKLK
jgi:hypothetical protein